MAVLISQNRRLLFILVKAQLYQPRQTAVFLYAARQGDETIIFFPYTLEIPFNQTIEQYRQNEAENKRNYPG